MSTISSFRSIEDRGKDCMKKFCEFLKEHIMKIINFPLENFPIKKIPIVFHNGSNYDCHFIVNELAEEFKKPVTCLGDNTDKYMTFTVPVEKEVTKIGKMEKKLTKIYLTYYNLLIAPG